MLTNKKFIFFDLDGVLTETRGIHFQAFHESLQTIGIFLTEEEHTDKYDGLPTRVKLEALRSQYNLCHDQLLAIDQEKQRLTINLLKNKIEKDYELIKIMEVLSKKYRMCVCSNARRDSLDLTLEKIGISSFFEFTLSQQDDNAPKPSSDIYLKAVEIFKAQKEDCLIFEDSPHGIISAETSGIDYIKVTNSFDLKNRIKGLVG
jgi:beta-phosphoglucomutase